MIVIKMINTHVSNNFLNVLHIVDNKIVVMKVIIQVNNIAIKF